MNDVPQQDYMVIHKSHKDSWKNLQITHNKWLDLQTYNSTKSITSSRVLRVLFFRENN